MFTTKTRGPIQPNQPAKKCAIMHLPTGRMMKYDEDMQMLYFDEDSFTIFPSKQRAISARHHGIATEKAIGKVDEWKEIYQVVEV